MTKGAPLDAAIACNDLKAVRFLLQKGQNPNGFHCCISHLAYAAKLNHEEILLALLDRGAIPQQSGALWEAAEAGNLAIAKVLVERGVDVDEIISQPKFEDDDTEYDILRKLKIRRFRWSTGCGAPLHAAADGDHAEMVEFLLRQGANKNLESPSGGTAATIVGFNIDHYSGHQRDQEDKVSEEESERVHNLRLKIMKLLDGTSERMYYTIALLIDQYISPQTVHFRDKSAISYYHRHE